VRVSFHHVDGDVPGLPSGVVTFVMTDIEGSTRMWQAAPEAMPEAIRRHNEIIAAAVAAHGGWTLQERGEGDSTFNVFANPFDAVAAAAVGQAALRAEVWPEGCPIRVRMAVLTGRVTIHDGEYMGTTINRTARLRSVARGGETFVAASTTAMLTGVGAGARRRPKPAPAVPARAASCPAPGRHAGRFRRQDSGA